METSCGCLDFSIWDDRPKDVNFSVTLIALTLTYGTIGQKTLTSAFL